MRDSMRKIAVQGITLERNAVMEERRREDGGDSGRVGVFTFT